MATTEAALLDPIHELPHEPGPEDLWQESVVLLFQDPRHRVGGFVRLGHHPNLGTAACTFGVVTPGPWYTRRCKDVSMRPGDRSSAGFAADGFMTAEFQADTNRWRAKDDLCEVDLEVTNSSPLYDTWELAGLTGAFRDAFAPRHTETAGTVRGTVRIEDSAWDIDGFAYRDHSWGLRNHDDPAAALANFFWLNGSFGPDFIFQVSELVSQGGVRTALGYVLIDGELDVPRVTDAAFEVELDGLTMRSAHCVFETPKFGEFDFRIDGFGNVLLAMGDQYMESAMPGQVTWNGRTGGAHVSAMFNARSGSAIPAWLFGAATENGIYVPPRFPDAGVALSDDVGHTSGRDEDRRS
jgi:hypothetical protein